MTSERPFSPTSVTTPSARTTRARVGRMAALTAGATLGLGVLAVPFVTATSDGVDTTPAVALAADAAAPAVTLGTTSVKPGGEVSFTAIGFPAGGP